MSSLRFTQNIFLLSLLTFFAQSSGAVQQVTDSFTMLNNISVSEALKRVARVATNSATPTEELWYSHVKIGITLLSALKKSVELGKTQQSGLVLDIVSGLMSDSDAQKRVTAESLNQVLKIMVERQIDLHRSKTNTDGTKRYTEEQLSEFKEAHVYSSVSRIITGQATRKERILFWLTTKFNAAVEKVRSWFGGTPLGAEAEITSIATAAAEVVSDGVTQVIAGAQKVIEAVSHQTVEATKFVMEQTQNGVELIIEGSKYTAEIIEKTGSLIITTTIDAKNYVVECVEGTAKLVLKSGGEILKTFTPTATETGTDLSPNSIAKMTALPFTQKTLAEALKTVREITTAPQEAAQKIINGITENVTYVTTSIQDTIAGAHELLQKTVASSKGQLLSASEAVASAFMKFTEGIGAVLSDPLSLLTGTQKNMMGVEQSAINEPMTPSKQKPTAPFKELSPEMFGNQSLQEFAESIGAQLEKLELQNNENKKAELIKTLLEGVNTRVESATIRKIEPAEFKKLPESALKQVHDAWLEASTEELMSIKANDYVSFTNELLAKIDATLKMQIPSTNIAAKEHMVATALSQRGTSLQQLAQHQTQEEDEEFHDAVETQKDKTPNENQHHEKNEEFHDSSDILFTPEERREAEKKAAESKQKEIDYQRKEAEKKQQQKEMEIKEARELHEAEAKKHTAESVIEHRK